MNNKKIKKIENQIKDRFKDAEIEIDNNKLIIKYDKYNYIDKNYIDRIQDYINYVLRKYDDNIFKTRVYIRESESEPKTFLTHFVYGIILNDYVRIYIDDFDGITIRILNNIRNNYDYDEYNIKDKDKYINKLKRYNKDENIIIKYIIEENNVDNIIDNIKKLVESK